jgi:hypothetical protein
MGTRWIVTGPAATFKDSAGKIVYRYLGAPVPDGLDDEQRDRLAADGLIGEVDDDTGLPPRRAAEDNESARETASTSSTVERPKQTAPIGEWVDYAVSQGASRQDAEKLSKPELISRYGK